MAFNEPSSVNISQLPGTAVVNPTDLFVLFRNGKTYGVPASAIPTSAINPAYFYNVLSYGALGDGSTVNDAAFLAVLAAASATKGIIYTPQGNFVLSNAFTGWANWPSGVSLMGAGPGATTITIAGGAVPPGLLSSASGASYINISGISFVGNAVNPAPPPNAPAVITFNGGVQNFVDNCLFTGNKGDCVDMLGCTGSAVRKTRFYNTGYSGSGTNDDTLSTPAVFMDQDCVDCYEQDNYYEGVQYHAMRILGTNCAAYWPYIKNPHVNGIRVGSGSVNDYGAGTKIIAPTVIGAKNVGGTGGTAIYVTHTKNVILEDPEVSLCDGDGVSWAGNRYSTHKGGVIFNCCQVSGDCGVQFNPQAGQVNVGMTFIGITSYDDQGTPTQKDGMRVLGPGATVTNTTIVGNNFPGFTGMVGGNPQYGIEMTDGILDDDTNVVRSNSGSWLDYEHLGVAVTVPQNTTATGVGTPSGSVMGNYNFQKGELGLSRGVKVSAWGVVTVAVHAYWYLSYGNVLGNWFTYDTTSPLSGVEWLLEAEMYGNGVTNPNQRVVYKFYVDGALVASAVATLTVDATIDEPIVLQATTGAGDSVTADAFTLVRQ